MEIVPRCLTWAILTIRRMTRFRRRCALVTPLFPPTTPGQMASAPASEAAVSKAAAAASPEDEVDAAFAAGDAERI